MSKVDARIVLRYTGSHRPIDQVAQKIQNKERCDVSGGYG
jgi:hypothetical protein